MVTFGYDPSIHESPGGKPGAAGNCRVEMCRLACDQTSRWIMVDDWEALQTQYQRTALVLDHFDQEINKLRGGVEDIEGALLHCDRASKS